jgi:hypothetical protein
MYILSDSLIITIVTLRIFQVQKKTTVCRLAKLIDTKKVLSILHIFETYKIVWSKKLPKTTKKQQGKILIHEFMAW